MGKIKFVFRRIREMDFKALFAVVGRMHKKSGKSRIVLFFDVIICGFKYGAGYRDYELYEFYNLTAKERATYIVRTTNNLIIAHCNKKDYYHCLNDKVEFNEKYSQYLKRDWLDFRSATKEEFLAFIADKKAIIVKPVDASCGVGVEKITVSDFESNEAIYEKLKSTKGADLLEDYIIQHHKMLELYPYAVNTCRIMTLLKDGEVHVMFAALRIGNKGKVVDNINNGGIFAPIDIKTGTLEFDGCDKDGNTYKKHPMTGTAILGFEIPYWNEALEMCKEAAMITPEIRYCGWDVAIIEDGVLFVEANNMPGYDIMQLPQHTPDKIGMLPVYRELLKDEMNI